MLPLRVYRNICRSFDRIRALGGAFASIMRKDEHKKVAVVAIQNTNGANNAERIILDLTAEN